MLMKIKKGVFLFGLIASLFAGLAVYFRKRKIQT